MGILIDAGTKVIVQGITGNHGSYHTKLMLDYGTKILAGVSPGKGGLRIGDLPVFGTVEEAVDFCSPDASIVFVPAASAYGAVSEVIANGIKMVVVITEFMPIRDSVKLMAQAAKSKVTIIGPNTPGIITPGECKLGVMPTGIFLPGSVGLVSRSGTLSYEVVASLTAAGLGQSTCLGIGGDPVVGLNFIDALEYFKKDEKTRAVALVGEIGGNMEEMVAHYIVSERYPKPVVAYVAGRFAPVGKRLGHAGAIVLDKQDSAESKIGVLRNAGVKIADKPTEVPKLIKNEFL